VQRNRFVAVSAIGLAAAALGGGTKALAQPHQGASNNSLRDYYGVVAELVDELGFDQRDYGGRRVTAIADLNAAKSELLQALQYRHQVLRQQTGSDNSLREEYKRLQQVIARLTADNTDYGGHKATALADLQKAQTELEAALVTM
jgi:hypothetical protein